LIKETAIQKGVEDKHYRSMMLEVRMFLKKNGFRSNWERTKSQEAIYGCLIEQISTKYASSIRPDSNICGSTRGQKKNPLKILIKPKMDVSSHRCQMQTRQWS